MLKHPDLGNALVQLYPQADFLRDYRCEDSGDGQGPRLAYWNTEKMGPEPTLKQIEKAAKEFDDAKPGREKKNKIRQGISMDEFLEAYFESKLGNEAPMTALLERYKGFSPDLGSS